MKYSPERREAILAKLEAPYNRTVSVLATEEGISAATLYKWRKPTRRTGRLLPNASPHRRLEPPAKVKCCAGDGHAD